MACFSSAIRHLNSFYMTKQSFVASVIITIAVIASARYFIHTEEKYDQAKPIENTVRADVIPVFPEINHTIAQSTTGIISPFGRGAPPPPKSLEERIRVRKVRMEKNGYSTPPEYYAMSLQELHIRAKQNDVYALLQLGEQYWSESEELVDAPSFDKALPPKDNAIKWMTAAVGQGHSRAATLVSLMYESQGQELQAYTWALISERMGDLSIQDHRKGFEAQLTENQRYQAVLMADKTNSEIQTTILDALRNKAGAR
ncbi:hypothetical protein [Duganella sp. S19_KUP01_CR8]|uniref:hypothetical protein n=1 Tax=Duganella sp. S19_KUP01_CR8 TaxID=3025502 RepID=UPI002FCD8D54